MNNWTLPESWKVKEFEGKNDTNRSRNTWDNSRE